MKRKILWLLPLTILAVVFMGSCNFGEKEAGPSGDGAMGGGVELVAAATPYNGPGAGEYYNAASDCLLRLDGEGRFSLTVSGQGVSGTYSGSEDELVLVAGDQEAYAYPGGGGYVLSGMAGLFLQVEEKSSFAELGVLRASDREYSEETGGLYRLSDYSLQLALRYPETMSAPENLVPDAVVIWDKASGYVVGRNVTESFGDAEAEKFMEGYMSDCVLPDFRQLYGEAGEFESVESLDEGISGRLASSEGIISGAGQRIYVKCIMYTSTYSDGTVNYICKCFFAPEGDEGVFNALANSVVNMTAVRRR